MLRRYKTVLVIQSYPTLTHVVNNINSLPKPVLVIVFFERDIYKFLLDLKIEGLHVISLGSAMILRKSILSFLRNYYIRHVIEFCKKVSTDKLIITFRNYSDMSALPIYFLDHKKLEMWIPFEEKRYQYHRDPNKKLLKFQVKISKLTKGLVEKKYFTGSNKQVLGNCVGLNLRHPLITGAERLNLKQINKINKSISNSVSPDHAFVVIVERELWRTGHISFRKYVSMLVQLRKIFKESGLKVYIKFKPRHFYLMKYIVFKFLGYGILATRAPVQFYCSSDNCKMILGFTSSALAIDYGKPIVCLASLEDTFTNSLEANITSMKERVEADQLNIVFVKELDELYEYV